MTSQPWRTLIETIEAAQETTLTPRLTALHSAAQQLEELTTQTVHRARVAGASWAEVGTALEVTKQAAQQRYGNPWSWEDSPRRRAALGHQDEPDVPAYCTCGELTKDCPDSPRAWSSTRTLTPAEQELSDNALPEDAPGAWIKKALRERGLQPCTIETNHPNLLS